MNESLKAAPSERTGLRLPTLAEIEAARGRVAPFVLPIPLIPLDVDDAPARIHLQLENLQPVGSYKLRGAGNAILGTDPAILKSGVATVSAGNLGQGVAWFARRLGFPCLILVPDHAPEAKVNALRRYGAEVRRITLDDWWRIMSTGVLPGYDGFFLHGVFDQRVMAGYGAIGLELLEQVPNLDAVVIPFGGGAMTCGIAAALKAHNPKIAIYACEVETGAPLKAALDKDSPVEVEYTPSFVDGIGSRSVFPSMWPLLKSVVTDSIVVTLDEVRASIRLLAARHRVIAEGAGAAALAAALSGRAGRGEVACIISGGHIDPHVLAGILSPKSG
jgi:threonine dehydratase